MTWTYSYSIPLDSTNSTKKHSDVCARAHGSNIYMFADTALKNIQANRMDIFVFNIKTTEIRCVNYEVPEHFGDVLGLVDMDGDNVYLWRECFDTSQSLLFKFDISTESLIHILSVAARRNYRRCPIIGDTMYALAYDEDYTLYLLTIDLSKEELVAKTCLANGTSTRPKAKTHYMIEVKNTLYILDIISDNERIVYKVVNGELSLLSHQHFNDEGHIHRLTTWTGELEYKKTTEKGTVYYTDKFDFETLTWSREGRKEDDPWSCSDVNRIQSVELVDGVRYVVMRKLGSECAEYDLKLFEIIPKLSTKCYLNIVEEVVQNDNFKELENVKRQLPLSMSNELEELIGWRKREKDIITAENERKMTQMKAATREIIFMELDQVIDSGVVEAFFDVFDALNVFGIE